VVYINEGNEFRVCGEILNSIIVISQAT